MLSALEFVATFACALFAGASLYINLVEHPARMGLDTRTAVSQWAPSYKRATWLQAPLALVSLLAGLGAWWLTRDLTYLLAALLIGAVVPFTVGVIMPTNHSLLTPGRDLDSGDTRSLLEHWGRLHAVRTLLSVAALTLYVWRVAAA